MYLGHSFFSYKRVCPGNKVACCQLLQMFLCFISLEKNPYYSHYEQQFGDSLPLSNWLGMESPQSLARYIHGCVCDNPQVQFNWVERDLPWRILHPCIISGAGWLFKNKSVWRGRQPSIPLSMRFSITHEVNSSLLPYKPTTMLFWPSWWRMIDLGQTFWNHE